MAKPTFIAKIEHTVAGIPCIIGVGYRHVQKPLGARADNDIDARGYTDNEWRLCDSRGYLAEWLERKLTPELEIEVELAIERHYEERDRD